jgi:hypothetical protein
MKWVDNTDQGETDIWEAVNDRAKSLVNNLMPRTEQWMDILSGSDEDQSVVSDVKDYLASLYRTADARGVFERHFKQVLLYGSSGLRYHWERRYRQQTFGPAETLRVLDHHGIPLAPGEDIEKTHKQYSFPVMDFNGPVFNVVDMHDLYIDPAADLNSQQTLSTIVRTYWTVEDLRRAVNENGEPRFENTDGLMPMTIEQINGYDVADRMMINLQLGINNLATRNNTQKYVPVYVFHKQLRDFDCVDETYVDTYFYVANSGSEHNLKLLAVETNPSMAGHRSVFIDTYEDWIDGGYGIGAVEKSLSDYRKKNVMSALHLNAAVASVFSGYSVIAGVLQDDRKAQFYPGGINTINKTSVGLEYIAPLPTPKDGVMLGAQAQEWYAQKIAVQIGAQGAQLNSPTKTPQQSKTATQINTEATQGSVADTCLIERVEIRTLEPSLQAVYDDARQYATDDIIEFEQAKNGTLSMGTLERAVLNAARKVVVTGYHASMNRQAEVEERREAMNVLTTGNAMQLLPNGVAILQKLVLSVLGRLNVPGLDQLEQDPVQLVMQDPRVQQELNQLTTQKAQAMFLQLTGQAPPGPIDQNIPPPPNTPQQDPLSSPAQPPATPGGQGPFAGQAAPQQAPPPPPQNFRPAPTRMREGAQQMHAR